MKDFVILTSFTEPSQMAIARSLLESQGIECQTVDEFTVQTYNFISNAIGGIKILVHQSDLQVAKDLLVEAGFMTGEEHMPSAVELYLGDPKNIKAIKMVAFFLLLIAVVIVITLFIKA